MPDPDPGPGNETVVNKTDRHPVLTCVSTSHEVKQQTNKRAARCLGGDTYYEELRKQNKEGEMSSACCFGVSRGRSKIRQTLARSEGVRAHLYSRVSHGPEI